MLVLNSNFTFRKYDISSSVQQTISFWHGIASRSRPEGSGRLSNLHRSTLPVGHSHCAPAATVPTHFGRQVLVGRCFYCGCNGQYPSSTDEQVQSLILCKFFCMGHGSRAVLGSIRRSRKTQRRAGFPSQQVSRSFIQVPHYIQQGSPRLKIIPGRPSVAGDVLLLHRLYQILHPRLLPTHLPDQYASLH